MAEEIKTPITKASRLTAEQRRRYASTGNMPEMVLAQDMGKLERELTLVTQERDALREAIKTFRATAGKHEGDHGPWCGVCKKCDASYVAAEEILDQAIALQTDGKS